MPTATRTGRFTKGERQIAKRLGERLRALRKQKGMSQDDLAACVQSPRKPSLPGQDAEDQPTVNRSAIADYETARRLPSLRTLVALADALDVDVVELLLEVGVLKHRVALAAINASTTKLSAAAKALGVTH